jgi:hypothetical protein
LSALKDSLYSTLKGNLNGGAEASVINSVERPVVKAPKLDLHSKDGYIKELTAEAA